MDDDITVLVGLILMIASMVFALGAIWWWAIFGMSENVGLASFATFGFTAFLGMTLAIAGAED